VFCVRCGREGKTYEALCRACFLESNVLATAPEVLDLTVCAHCGDYLIDKKWATLDDAEEAVLELAEGSVAVRQGARIRMMDSRARRMDPKTWRVAMSAFVVHDDLEAEAPLEATVRIKRTSCPKCNKVQGNYFESIVQVRPSGKRFSDEEKEEILSRMMATAEDEAKDSRDAFIAKVTQEHGGFDAYVSTIALGKAMSRTLASVYGAELKESSTLQGKKDGNDIYRVTFLVRLPPYRAHDVVSIGGRLYLVRSTGPKSAKLRDLKSYESITAMNQELRDAKVVGTKADYMDAVILGLTEREVQLMHPRTFATVELKVPRGFKITGDTVKVLLHDGELHLVSN